MGTDTPIDQRIQDALREVDDPEVGLNVLDLGLVYGIDTSDGTVRIRMTMTTPACPLGSYIKDQVREGVRRAVPEAMDIQVELVWNPPWSPEMMSEYGRKHFGWGGT